MNDRILRVLEYTKIKHQLSEHVSSSLGKEKVNHLTPWTNYEDVTHQQNSTDEGAQVLRLKGNVPLGGIRDIRASIKRTEIGGILSPEELVDIGTTIYGGRRFKRFIEGMLEDEVDLPILSDFIDQIDPLIEVEQKIKECIDDQGHVMDTASPALRTIRQQLRSYESRIREKLESIIRSSKTQKMLSDTIVTIRNDRYVIPVKQEYRSAFGGMVHDQSASGATLFIEPQAVVTINNQLKEAKSKEHQEIQRILKSLSDLVAEVSSFLSHNVTVLSEIDFIFAKARYGHSIKAVKPKINDQQYMKLKRARHPMIPLDEVVPIDVELGGEYNSLVITGPNTGGKTVTLKTIGLLSLMAQSGLQIPVEEESEVTVFESIYADIGDEQSIEQNLSTFSSHMTNIVNILDQVNFKSLVLFDELGAGTDPTEGAALAISILDYVNARGSKIVATTHYSELKAYAYNREGVMNASVEFDVETLRPTYRLLIGVPGRSNAFEISRRIGLDDRIIEDARSHISEDNNKIDVMIASLENAQKQAEQERSEANDINREAQQLKQDLERKMQEFDQYKDKLYEKAENEAKKSVENARAEADEILKELRAYQKDHGNVKEHKLIEAQKRLDEATPNKSKSFKKKTSKQAKVPENLKPGEEVKVLTVNQKGHIVDKVGPNEYQVQVGIMKMTVKANELEQVKQEKKPETKPVVRVEGSSVRKPELDLRGERYDNALRAVDKFLDESLLAGYPQVSIIHGKGTGALRNGVQSFLKEHPNVKSTRFGSAGEGGSGVTIVGLK
ncbi:endonuclease MutS2 [Pseudalkalibacillus berkeleyi]|uniref:Endonuclease MutS2 n=1 Tax=Pseudalkalibacillus berkeleyi TaxID=1069813 RepID=A0ABS9H232_9BACL|nr:endonuclease MutS2 [Pseudalkalibacillus berkeleyi]MCF6138166.1 endonuclease MutS2 [Pseudalkalibacillus berkeleyi]